MIGKQSTGGMGGSDSFKKDNIASKLIVEDHLKSMLAKSQNTNYKPWKNDQAPKNPHSPFGDFPKSHMTKTASPTKLDQVHETSHATTKQSTRHIPFMTNLLNRNRLHGRSRNRRSIHLTTAEKADRLPTIPDLRCFR